jgi:hypothetical protein
MRDIVRLLLMLGIAACVATLIGAAFAWWMEEQRRMTRLAFRVLGGTPDAVIVAQGRGAAAAFRLETGKVLVMRRNGAFALLYPMTLLQGAEMVVDDQVVARVAEGEPRRLLDRIPATAEHVALRLIFDDPRHPDFNLELWRPEDAARRNSRPAPLVIQEARGWLSRAEAILRRRAMPPPSAPLASVGTPAPPAPPAAIAPIAPPRDDTFSWEDDDEDEALDDDVEADEPATPPPQAATPEPAPPEPPPWDADEDEPEPPPRGGRPGQLRLF